MVVIKCIIDGYFLFDFDVEDVDEVVKLVLGCLVIEFKLLLGKDILVVEEVYLCVNIVVCWV